MITQAKNKATKPRKKKAQATVEELAEEIRSDSKARPEVSKPADILASGKEPKKCSCARCHATVEFKQTSKCQNCGVYGCTECGYDPKEKICATCGARR